MQGPLPPQSLLSGSQEKPVFTTTMPAGQLEGLVPLPFNDGHAWGSMASVSSCCRYTAGRPLCAAGLTWANHTREPVRHQANRLSLDELGLCLPT